MPFCWICSFSSDYDSKTDRGRKWRLQVRVPAGVPGEEAGSDIRFSVDLPSPDWYLRRVRSHNLDANGGSAPKLVGQFRHRGATIIGLVKVAEGPYYEGPMTEFSAEAQLQWDAYYEPLDAFVIQIEESWQLESPYHCGVLRWQGRFAMLDFVGLTSKLHASKPAPSQYWPAGQ